MGSGDWASKAEGLHMQIMAWEGQPDGRRTAIIHQQGNNEEGKHAETTAQRLDRTNDVTGASLVARTNQKKSNMGCREKVGKMENRRNTRQDRMNSPKSSNEEAEEPVDKRWI
ncbi:hypothetical protein CFIO01_12440 [Colletotrichum fioriniae PJ7]|uniref:Uncharacterized protein n=1 Tax=Colletotrichum fioriniae PJ7 TaxID=1445577 RepID=A0A010QC15_9PEZI|nr:hypothetical protein CFIO01_12440 [Colletotrichum fioriniae PJ7]